MEEQKVDQHRNIPELNEYDAKMMPKSRLKKIQRYEAKVEWKKQHRKAERERKKWRLKKNPCETKKENQLKLRQRLLEIHNDVKESDCLNVSILKELLLFCICRRTVDSFQVCIDVQFEKSMNNKELVHLALQLCRTYGLNKSAEKPAKITLANFIGNY
jgi:hypothetical protein